MIVVLSVAVMVMMLHSLGTCVDSPGVEVVMSDCCRVVAGAVIDDHSDGALEVQVVLVSRLPVSCGGMPLDLVVTCSSELNILSSSP